MDWGIENFGGFFWIVELRVVLEFSRLSEGRDALDDGIMPSGLVDRVDLRSDFSIN